MNLGCVSNIFHLYLKHTHTDAVHEGIEALGLVKARAELHEQDAQRQEYRVVGSVFCMLHMTQCHNLHCSVPWRRFRSVQGTGDSS